MNSTKLRSLDSSELATATGGAAADAIRPPRILGPHGPWFPQPRPTPTIPFPSPTFPGPTFPIPTGPRPLPTRST